MISSLSLIMAMLKVENKSISHNIINFINLFDEENQNSLMCYHSIFGVTKNFFVLTKL